MNNERIQVILFIQGYIKKDPKAWIEILQAMDRGLSQALSDSREQSSEYEFALSAMLQNSLNKKKAEEFAKEKIKKYVAKKKNYCNWPHNFSEESEISE